MHCTITISSAEPIIMSVHVLCCAVLAGCCCEYCTNTGSASSACWRRMNAVHQTHTAHTLNTLFLFHTHTHSKLECLCCWFSRWCGKWYSWITRAFLDFTFSLCCVLTNPHIKAEFLRIVYHLVRVCCLLIVHSMNSGSNMHSSCSKNSDIQLKLHNDNYNSLNEWTSVSDDKHNTAIAQNDKWEQNEYEENRLQKQNRRKKNSDINNNK